MNQGPRWAAGMWVHSLLAELEEGAGQRLAKLERQHSTGQKHNYEYDSSTEPHGEGESAWGHTAADPDLLCHAGPPHCVHDGS